MKTNTLGRNESKVVLRSALALVIALVMLGAVPAYSWHGSGSITALAIDPQTPTTLYAGTSDRGVFKSTDGGATWTATGLTGVYITALAIGPQTPSTVYAGTENDGVFKTAGGGESWSAINSGLTDLHVADLAVDPQTPATLYAVFPGGVFKRIERTDGGAIWNLVLGNEWSSGGPPVSYTWRSTRRTPQYSMRRCIIPPPRRNLAKCSRARMGVRAGTLPS